MNEEANIFSTLKFTASFERPGESVIKVGIACANDTRASPNFVPPLKLCHLKLYVK